MLIPMVLGNRAWHRVLANRPTCSLMTVSVGRSSRILWVRWEFYMPRSLKLVLYDDIILLLHTKPWRGGTWCHFSLVLTLPRKSLMTIYFLLHDPLMIVDLWLCIGQCVTWCLMSNIAGAPALDISIVICLWLKMIVFLLSFRCPQSWHKENEYKGNSGIPRSTQDSEYIHVIHIHFCIFITIIFLYDDEGIDFLEISSLFFIIYKFFDSMFRTPKLPFLPWEGQQHSSQLLAHYLHCSRKRVTETGHKVGARIISSRS